MEVNKSSTSSNQKECTSLVVVFDRLLWIAIGPAAMLITASFIVKHGAVWFSLPDLLFIAIIALIIFGRLFELRSGVAFTMDGQPATKENFKGYCIRLISTSACIWATLKVIAWFFPSLL
jgi:hypothetical protein